MQDDQCQLKSINEIIRIIDAKEDEDDYVKNKLGHIHDMIDIEARNAFKVGKVTTSMLKCVYGCNHYSQHDAMINDYIVEARCPRCEMIETWEHVLQCNENKKGRPAFVKDLMETLIKNKSKEVNEDKIMSFVEDIMKYAQNEQEGDYKSNQQYVGMQELFRRYIVIDWERTNFGNKKYKDLNKIIVKRCVEFYDACWKHRNDEYHNEEKQKKKLRDWYEKVKAKAENSDDTQIKLYVCKKRIDIDKCNNETIKRWLYNLKEFEKRIEKTKRNDIRRYFDL